MLWEFHFRFLCLLFVENLGCCCCFVSVGESSFPKNQWLYSLVIQASSCIVMALLSGTLANSELPTETPRERVIDRVQDKKWHTHSSTWRFLAWYLEIAFAAILLSTQVFLLYYDDVMTVVAQNSICLPSADLFENYWLYQFQTSSSHMMHDSDPKHMLIVIDVQPVPFHDSSGLCWEHLF